MAAPALRSASSSSSAAERPRSPSATPSDHLLVECPPTSSSMVPLDVEDAAHLPARAPMPGARPNCLERKSSWLDVAFLLIADIVGTGILGLAAQLARIGWGAGLFFLLVIYPLNIYSGLLLQRLHIAYPQTQSYADIGYAVLGPRYGVVVAAALYTYFFFVLGNYMQVLTQSLQGIFASSRLCMPYFGLIVTVCLVPSIQIRSLHGLAGLAVVSLITIFLPLMLCTAAVVETAPTPRPSTPVGVPEGTTFLEAMESFTGILFAYSGQSIYPNLLSEMRRPEQFTLSLCAAAPVLVGSYLVASVVGVYYHGNLVPYFLMDVLQAQWMRQLGGWCLFVHMLISYTITSSVVSRALHLWLDPKNANCATGALPRVQWFFIALAVALCSYCVSNIIPFFKDLTEIIGALNLGPISFGFPAGLYLIHRRRVRHLQLSAAKSDGGSCTLPTVMNRAELALLVLLLALCLYTVPVGMFADISALVADWHTFGGPFDCHRYSAEHRAEMTAPEAPQGTL